MNFSFTIKTILFRGSPCTYIPQFVHTFLSIMSGLRLTQSSDFSLPPNHFSVDFEICCFEDSVEFGASAVQLLRPLSWLALQKLPVEEAFDVRLPVLFTDRLHLNDNTVVG